MQNMCFGIQKATRNDLNWGICTLETKRCVWFCSENYLNKNDFTALNWTKNYKSPSTQTGTSREINVQQLEILHNVQRKTDCTVKSTKQLMINFTKHSDTLMQQKTHKHSISNCIHTKMLVRLKDLCNKILVLLRFAKCTARNNRNKND